MWVVRDFALEMSDVNGKKMTCDEYLETKLQEVPAGPNEEAKITSNKIRAGIKGFFVTRSCSTMVRPVVEENDLKILNQKKLSDLRPEFQEEVHQIRAKVLTKIKPKSLNNVILTGEMLFSLME